MNLKMSKKVEQAMAFHDNGYNCAQAVACSFCEEFGIDQETMFRVSEGFGLGMGMMDMCGAVTGMLMVIGMENSVGNLDGKKHRSLKRWKVLTTAVSYRVWQQGRRLFHVPSVLRMQWS